jgi:HEAT repeat protein
LIGGLADPLDNVRLAAVRGVRELNPELATAQLSRMLLEDPIWEIRVQAARGLGGTGDPMVTPVLETAMGDANEFVRSAAAHALEVHKRAREENRDEPSEVASQEGEAQP